MTPSFRHEDLARAMTDVDSGTAVAAKIGAALGAPIELEDGSGDLAVIVPDGFKVERLAAERFGDAPRRKRGHAQLHDLDSLIAYVLRHGHADTTTVFVDPAARPPRVQAVIDDHPMGSEHGEAGWGDHRASLDLVHTPEWNFWVGRDDDLMDQIEFAQMIEDGVKDVREPDAATLLEIVSTFHARSEAQFSKATRLDNGQVQYHYHEEVNASAGASGTMEIPSTFTLALPVFEGGPRYAVEARVRYRVSSGKLRIGYRLERLHDVLRYALQGDEDAGVVPRLRKELDAGVFVGTPPQGARA